MYGYRDLYVVYGSEGAGDGLDGGGDSIETHSTLLGGKDSNLQFANSGGEEDSKRSRGPVGPGWAMRRGLEQRANETLLAKLNRHAHRKIAI